MRLLLDTHALLRWLSDAKQLESHVRAHLEDDSNEILTSVASLWEIAVKMRVGKLRADIKEISDSLQREGFPLLGITTAHLLTLGTLPIHHRDPFDHLLIAQAIAENASFMSEDRNTRAYPVQLITCSNPPLSLA